MKVKYVCTKCGKVEDVTTRAPKCECGGLWKLQYELPKFDEALIDKDEWSIFRYRAFMPLADETWKAVTMGEGMTPIVPFDEDLMLKMDYFMPTLSFKDRGAAVLISHCKSIGVTDVVQDSSGNAGNSVAAYCGRVGIHCEIFIPEGTSPKKIDMIKAHIRSFMKERKPTFMKFTNSCTGFPGTFLFRWGTGPCSWVGSLAWSTLWPAV